MNTQHFSHTNNTSSFQVVGNHSVVISSHDTAAAANKSIDETISSICDSEWGIIEVVAPGETTKGTMQLGLTDDQINAGSSEPIFDFDN